MWLCTEDKRLINVDMVQSFDLNDTRIIANFPPISSGGETREVNVMVKRYASRDAAAAAYKRLIAGMDDLMDVEELSAD